MADEKKADDKAAAAAVAKEVAAAAEKVKSKVAARVAAIEARWGKSIQEVMCDVHDHVFGSTPEDASEGAAAEKPVEVGSGG